MYSIIDKWEPFHVTVRSNQDIANMCSYLGSMNSQVWHFDRLAEDLRKKHLWRLIDVKQESGDRYEVIYQFIPTKNCTLKAYEGKDFNLLGL